MNDKVTDILDSGRRDKMEIIAAITAITQKPSKITHILCQINLSYPLLKKYLKFMLRLGLIEIRKIAKADGGGEVFQATEKGFNFLKTYCDILRIIYGEDFLRKDSNLAVSCLKYCNETESASPKQS